jgi:hypothetical protein
MKFYSRTENGIVTSENKEALLKYYFEALECPEDYEPDKYILGDREEEHEVPTPDGGTEIQTVTVHDVLIPNPEWENIKRQKEEEHLDRLRMTALDLITAIKNLGVTDQQIEDFLNNNLNIKHQLQFCQHVYFGVVKQLLPLNIGGKEITVDVVENLFKAKNGEI